MRPPFFYLPPPHPGCSGILSAPRSGTLPPPAVPEPVPSPKGKHRSSARNIHAARHPLHRTQSEQTPRPLPAPAVSHRPSRAPSPTDTKKRLPAPKPLPFIHVRADTPEMPDTRIPRRPEKRRPAPPRAGEEHRSPPPTSASAPPAPPLAPASTKKKRHPRRNRHPTSASSPAPSAPLRAGWEKAPSSCHAFHARAARKSAASPHLSGPNTRLPHDLLSDAQTALPAPLLAAPAPAPRCASPPNRHKKSGSPLKAAALRSNRRAISCP